MSETDLSYRFDPATEGGRFSVPPMCTNLTGECARKFISALEHHEPDDGDPSTRYYSSIVFGLDGEPIKREKYEQSC